MSDIVFCQDCGRVGTASLCRFCGSAMTAPMSEPLPDFPTSLRQCGKALALALTEQEIAQHANTLLVEAAERIETLDDRVLDLAMQHNAASVTAERLRAELTKLREQLNHALNRKLRTQHDGDCSIYAARDQPDDPPEAGICTCGFAHQHQEGSIEDLYSKQLLSQIESGRHITALEKADGLALKWFRVHILRMGFRQFAEWLGHPRPAAILNVEQGRHHDESLSVEALTEKILSGEIRLPLTAEGAKIAEALRAAIPSAFSGSEPDPMSDIQDGHCLLVPGSPKCGYEGPESCDHTRECCERLGNIIHWPGPPLCPDSRKEYERVDNPAPGGTVVL